MSAAPPPGPPDYGAQQPSAPSEWSSTTTGSGSYRSEPAAMGPVTTQFARLDPGPSQTYGVVGATVAIIGAVLLVLSLTAADWYSFSGSRFTDIHDLVHNLGALAFGPAKLYFGWLAWVLAIVAVVGALIAVAPVVGGPLRVIAPIVALAGVVITFLAVQLISNGSDLAGHYSGYGTFLSHARLGFWFAVAGFVLTGIGALIGPAHRRG